MGTTTCLQEALQHTHDELCERLVSARHTIDRREISRRGCPPIDLFLSGTSKHLHAVDQVVLPCARHVNGEGSQLVHDHLGAAKQLEVLLAHVKAHEFGSVYETSFDWATVWSDVEEAFVGQWEQESRIGVRLSEALPDDELQRLCDRLAAAEERAPSRPHPFLPHTGAGGSLARRFMRAADAFWDAVEGRYVPQPRRKEHKRPGLIGQYLMADPRFEEEEPARESVERPGTDRQNAEGDRPVPR